MEDTAVEEAEVCGAAEFAPALVAAHPQGQSVAVAVGPELRVFDLNLLIRSPLSLTNTRTWLRRVRKRLDLAAMAPTPGWILVVSELHVFLPHPPSRCSSLPHQPLALLVLHTSCIIATPSAHRDGHGGAADLASHRSMQAAWNEWRCS